MKVLIAEDDIAINDLIRMNLSDAGFTCTCTHDGMAAADLLESENIKSGMPIDENSTPLFLASLFKTSPYPVTLVELLRTRLPSVPFEYFYTQISFNARNTP